MWTSTILYDVNVTRTYSVLLGIGACALKCHVLLFPFGFVPSTISLRLSCCRYAKSGVM